MIMQKIINSLFKILFLLILFVSYHNKLNSEIIYEKNDIIITNYEIEFYKKYFFEIYKEKINDAQSIKNIVLIRNLIKKIEKNNSEIINLIDDKISFNSKLNIQQNTIYRDFYRFLLLKNEYINEYTFNNLKPEDLLVPIDKLKFEKIPLGIKNCLVIDKVITLEEINGFENIYFEFLLRKNTSAYTTINNQEFEICLNSELKTKLEIEVINLIENLTSNDFKKLLYD